ncbi:DUF305 domain-containing protein [Streptomyces sp. NPDC001970]
MTFSPRALRRPLSALLPIRRRIALVGAVAAAGLLLAACGGDSGSGSDSNGHGTGGDTNPATSTPSAGGNPAPGAFNDADVTFAQQMIPHHEQALEMAELADGRAADAEIRTLAGLIERAQDPEIRTMKSWLKGWGRPESSGMDHAAGHDGSGGTAGMMSEQDMAALRDLTGADFDRTFAQLMIAHHNGAIEMAEDEQRNGRNATARKLAAAVVENQSAEVEQLGRILDRLGA